MWIPLQPVYYTRQQHSAAAAMLGRADSSKSNELQAMQQSWLTMTCVQYDVPSVTASCIVDHDMHQSCIGHNTLETGGFADPGSSLVLTSPSIMTTLVAAATTTGCVLAGPSIYGGFDRGCNRHVDHPHTFAMIPCYTDTSLCMLTAHSWMQSGLKLLAGAQPCLAIGLLMYTCTHHCTCR